MTPVLEPSLITLERASTELLLATAIARDALEQLAEESLPGRIRDRYQFAADRLTQTLDFPRPSRRRLLEASPAVLERSRRSRSLIEMIEAEPEDDEVRLRLAKLLLRALVWRPETFPYPPE
ncbi:hypothetical protein P12x_004452 [Tundrisphaera lichenicola]|uniref:hypothetical protein n=1 Tax=Tundrisphaera lichenicola TaxID=2029860 RepID=UPI003EB9C1DB